MKIFTFRDYREYIRFKIEENRATRGYQSMLADAAGCQRSFLSQVLNSHVQLTPDHAAGMARHWGLSEDEGDYFLLLVQHARATSPHLKQRLEKKMRDLREAGEDLSHRLKDARQLVGQQEVAYYSAWYLSAVHTLLSIPEFRTEKAISQRLNLPLALVQSALGTLESLDLVQRRGAAWAVKRFDLHLGNRSLFAANYHCNWRQKAIIRIQEQHAEDIHYTGVHTLSRKDLERVKELIRECIERAREVIAPSPEEELICFSVDLFRV